jgi:hypothetical protein
MTAKVTSLCDYRRNKDAEKKLRRGRSLGLPDFEMEPETFGTTVLFEFHPDDEEEE